MSKKENISWLFISLLITLGIAGFAWSILSSIFRYVELGYNSIDVTLRCVLSISLISMFVMGIRCSLNYEKPIASRKSAKIRKVIGWILVVLSIIGIVLSIISLIGNYQMLQRLFAEYGEQNNNYAINNAYTQSFLDFAGRDIIFSGLIFAWGYYLIKCGQMYSPIWKRIIKVLLYVIATFVILENSIPNPLTSWYGLIIIFLVMLALVAITTNYVKEPESQIIEDVEL
jgi:heme A synthase